MAAGEVIERAKVHVAMILVGIGYGGYFVLTKASLTGGVDPFVFSTYRDGIGCYILFLFAWTYEREHWSKMSPGIAGFIFSMAVMGIYLQQTFFLFGLQYTNILFAATMINCIPVWTLVIAALFRLEEVPYNRRDGQAKILGILTSVCGATVLTLYKGPTILEDSTPNPPLPGPTVYSDALFMALRWWKIDHWKLGALCLIASNFFCAAFVNIQIPALKRFPAPFTLMSGASFFGSIMFASTAFFRGQDTSQWVIPLGPDLLAAIYAGVVASGICLSFSCWANSRGGPILVAGYIPLHSIFSTVFGIIFLGNTLYLGSLFGAGIIISGLASVIWTQRESRRLQALSLDFPTQSTFDHLLSTKVTSTMNEPLLSKENCSTADEFDLDELDNVLII